MLTSDTTSRALLVDFGGVLTTSVRDSFAACSAALGGDPGLIARLLREDPPSSQLLVEHESGRLDDSGFERGFAVRLQAHGAPSVPVAGAGLIAHMLEGLRPDPPTIEAIAAVRAAGIPVALVSNSFGAGCYDGWDLDAIADEVVVSGRVGVRKPSRRIYRIACERLGVEPEACVLVDDVERNLLGAARLGIRGILHVEASATRAALAELFPTSTGADVPWTSS